MYRDIDPRPTTSASGQTLRAADEAGPTTIAPSPAEESRDVFSRDLDLPAGRPASASASTVASTRCAAPRCERLATVGAFRVVPAEELRRPDGARRTCSGRTSSTS